MTENIDPKTIMKKGLKNCVILAGISQPNMKRSTFLSANKVNDVPACSKQAQKAILITIKIINAIILSFHIAVPSCLSSFIPAIIIDIDIPMNKVSKI